MAISKRKDIFDRQSTGKTFKYPLYSTASGAVTSAVAASGFFTVMSNFNNIGSTLPGTLVSFPTPPTPAGGLFGTMFARAGNSTGAIVMLCRAYRFGTVSLSATGDRFTADAGVTFPMTRTQFGEATSPVSLIPFIYVTTATATTAPVIRLRTAAGAAGYVDQDGNSTVGTRTITFPAAATAAQSGFILRLEDGDCGVRSISAVEVTTAGTAGACSVFGLEVIAVSHNPVNRGVYQDKVFSGFSMNNLDTASTTSGSLTQNLLMHIYIGNASTSNHGMTFTGVVNS